MKFILLSVSLLFLIPKRTAKACGFWVFPGEYRFWILQPDLTNEPDLTPFYFASTYLYNRDINAGKETYRDQNLQEWFEETNGNASKKDIDLLLNETDPQEFFDNEESLIKKNSLMRFVKRPKQAELYQYLHLSKKVEHIAAHPDPWDEQAYPQTPILNVIEDARELYASSNSSFVKLRTAFQLVRLYNYNSQKELLYRVYDTYIEPVDTKSWIKTAALYQKAINATGPEYNYLLSKVFDKGGYNRTHCLTRFVVKDFDLSFGLAKNLHEKTVLLAMKLFNYPGRGLNEIKKIYAFEPGYKELPFLILREINKVEDWLLTTKVTDFETPAVYGEDYWDNYNYFEQAARNYRQDKAYANDLYDFLQQLIVGGKQKESALLHLYAAHLAMLNYDYVNSKKHIDLAKSQKNLAANVRTQIKVNTFLLRLESGFDKQAEDEFMSLIKASSENLGVYDPKIMKNQLILYTSRKMIQQGDRARGLLLLSKTNRALGRLPINFYKGVYQEIEERANEEDYEIIFSIFNKKSKSPFEHFICEKDIHSPFSTWSEDPLAIEWNYNKLLDCKASWYIRKHRLNEAYEVLKKIPDSFWKQYPYVDYIGGDPFFLNVYSAHAISKEDKRDLNKKEVIKEMIRLEQLANKYKSKAAECYYQLGNAWYNMTYHGKNWLMVKQWWSVNEPIGSGLHTKGASFNKDYYGCQMAKSFYDKAIQLTQDKKLAALCFFLSQKCKSNYEYYLRNLDNTDYAEYNFIPDYSLARTKGIDKEYYNDIVTECETYQSFIKQYNKIF